MEELRDNPGWVGAALRKGTGKPPWRKERAFVLAGVPRVAFSCLCGQWQGQQGQQGQQGHYSLQSTVLWHFSFYSKSAVLRNCWF